MDKVTAIIAWIEENVGGKVTEYRSQERWRDAWFATLERDGESLPLYIRADRNEEVQAGRLGLEAAALGILGSNGLPAPKIYGLCPDPTALIMELSPGRHNLATAQSEEERVSVLEHLGEIMAQMHMIDPATANAAGVPSPVDTAHAIMPYLLGTEASYRKAMAEPDPKVEYLLGWLHRNAPTDCPRVSLIAQDSGQFLFDQGRVTAMLDLELACIGDPMLDIAALRKRAVAEPMGDLRPLLRRYVATTGWELDRQRIAFHTASWQIGVTVQMTPVLTNPGPDVNFPEYLSWYAGCTRGGLQGMAEYLRMDLETEVTLPDSESSRWGLAYDSLLDRLAADAAQDGSYPNQLKLLTARFLAKLDRYGAWAEASYAADVGALTGATPATWRTADEAFGRFTAAAGPEHDRAIIALLNRWILRQEKLIEDLSAMPVGRMMPLDQLLDLAGE